MATRSLTAIGMVAAGVVSSRRFGFDAGWLTETAQQADQAAASMESLRRGPLGWVMGIDLMIFPAGQCQTPMSISCLSNHVVIISPSYAVSSDLLTSQP